MNDLDTYLDIGFLRLFSASLSGKRKTVRS